MKHYHLRTRLLGSTIMAATAVVFIASGQAAAQSAPSDAATPATTVKEVVVTGSILRHKALRTDAPLTIETAADLEQRGITTIESAVQNLSGNNSGALPNSFSANGAFAAGASAASLRGLTTNSTLVLIDGLRAAYYPLSDDGLRNFVDLNAIPDVVVDRIEVLQDGASSTYGADAIAGVINVITKKNFQGLTGKGEWGWAEQGGAGHVNVSGIWGRGDKDSDGYNLYVAAEFQRDEVLYNRQRGFPYNTANLSSLCAQSLAPPGSPNVVNGISCRTNGVQNGLQFDGSFAGVGATGVAAIRPYNAANTTPQGDWRLANPAAGCRNLTPVTITPAEAAAGHTGGFTSPETLCQQDLVHDYRVLTPQDERFSLTAHLTKKLWEGAEGYLEFNFYQNTVAYSGTPDNIRGVTTPGATGQTFSTANIALPVYICPRGTVGPCNAGNGTLNPNNPFASSNEVARIRYRFTDIPHHDQQLDRSYRLAGGIQGELFGDWRYNIDGVYMQNDLRWTQQGYIYVQHLLDVVADGSYNFLDPSQNSGAVRNYLAPTLVNNPATKLGEIEGVISRKLWELPGGPLQLGLGAVYRYESINDPSDNPDNNGPTQRYLVLNPFGVKGSRTVEAAFFELDAPIARQFDVNLSGRFDHYSTGQQAFSPKVGARFRPWDWITLRGTWSKGFRIPSLAESNQLPNTGFITPDAPASFQAAHGNDGYGQGYPLGLTTAGTPGLKPEESTNITAGIVLEPSPHFSFTLDYYRIEKRGVIAPADYTPAINAYFAGQPIPAGYQVVPGLPDPNFPNALPVPGFVVYGFANLDRLVTDGYDFGASTRWDFGWAKWTSNASATYLDKYDLSFPDGTVQHYAGTLGPFQVTSASGTPRWRANWSNTLDFGRWTATATVYYTSGYSETAEDNGAIANNCLGSVGTGTPTTYRDGATPVVCNVKPFTDVALHLTYNLRGGVQLYGDVDNLFAAKAPYDPTTYGGWQYNPAWSNSGVVGRYFKIGVKATF